MHIPECYNWLNVFEQKNTFVTEDFLSQKAATLAKQILKLKIRFTENGAFDVSCEWLTSFGRWKAVNKLRLCFSLFLNFLQFAA